MVTAAVYPSCQSPPFDFEFFGRPLKSPQLPATHTNTSRRWFVHMSIHMSAHMSIHMPVCTFIPMFLDGVAVDDRALRSKAAWGTGPRPLGVQAQGRWGYRPKAAGGTGLLLHVASHCVFTHVSAHVLHPCLHTCLCTCLHGIFIQSPTHTSMHRPVHMLLHRPTSMSTRRFPTAPS